MSAINKHQNCDLCLHITRSEPTKKTYLDYTKAENIFAHVAMF